MSESGVSQGTISSDGSISETVSTSNAPGAQPQGAQGEAAPVAEWSPEKLEAYKTSQAIYSKMSERTSERERAEDWSRVSAIHKYLHLGADRPAFLAPKDEAPDLTPYSSERAAWNEANASKPMNEADQSHLEMHGRVIGMPPEAATAMASVVSELQLDAAGGKSMLNAIAPYFGSGDISGDGFRQMSNADFAVKAEAAIREAGGEEKLRLYSAGARELLAAYPRLNAALERQGAFNQSAAALDVGLLIRLHSENERRKARGK